MEIKFDLTDALVKKIRAYNILTGNQGAIEDTLIGLLDKTVSEEIAKEVGVSLSVQTTGFVHPTHVVNVPPVVTTTHIEEDVTGIADGLGDDDDEMEQFAANGIEAFIPESENSLTDEMIDSDFDLDDGVTVGPPEENKEERPENVFAGSLGLDHPPLEPDHVHKKRARRERPKSRAKVTLGAQ